MLDDLQRRDRAGGQHLKRALQRLHHDVSGEILRHALPDQKQAAHQREGQEHPGGDPNQVGKEVAHVVLCFPGQPPDEGHAGGVAAGGGDKHHKGDDQHLGEIGQSRLTGIVLEVGVCHKADDGVEGKGFLHGANPVGVEQANTLNPQDDVSNQNHNGIGS